MTQAPGGSVPSADRTTAASRVPRVDALRGASMLGVMLVNFSSMNTRAGQEMIAYGGAQGSLDRAVDAINMSLLNAKFYPLFALLFGWGLEAQRERGGGARPPTGFISRLLVLLGLGVLHVVLVWWGDVLAIYAVVALAVLPILRMPPRTLLRTAVALLIGMPLLAWMAQRGGASRWVVSPGLDAVRSDIVIAAVYASGSFRDLVHQRALDWLTTFTPLARNVVTLGAMLAYVKYYCVLAGLFLVGAWARRVRLAETLGDDRDRTARWWLVSLLAAGILTVVRHAFTSSEGLVFYWQGLAVAAWYGLSFWRLFPRLGALQRPLSATGRMSLTAYLAHTTAASALLHGTGLGLYGRIGGATLLPIAAVCYIGIVSACSACSTRFALGPAEWVLRTSARFLAIEVRRGNAGTGRTAI